MTLTKEEAAAQMNGCEYGDEGTPELFAAMKKARLVAVFGYSDDVTELRGAVEDETYSAAYFTRDGILENKCESGCAYFEREKRAAKKLTANFGNEGWTYDTTIPHASFDVMEDGELYGKGLVFSLDDLG